MSIYDKKLYIKKTDGNIQTANLYTDKNYVGDNYLTFKYNGNTVYAVLSSNGDIDFNVSYNHNLYKIKNTFKVVWKTDEYRIYKLYPSIYQTMTELPNDRDWIEFVRYRKNLNGMFGSCKKLTTIPIFDTQDVTSMSNMFSFCYNLTAIPLFDTSNVNDMSYMFYECNSLTELPIFDIKSVTSIRNMIIGTKITHITFKNKPANLEVTPEILGKPDVQITFV